MGGALGADRDRSWRLRASAAAGGLNPAAATRGSRPIRAREAAREDRRRRARRLPRCVRAAFPGRAAAPAGRSGAGARERGGMDHRTDRGRSCRRGGGTGARGAQRATRRVARCDGALCGAPDVPDVLSPVCARGARLTGGRGGGVARRDPAAGEGRPERARPGAGRVELEPRWPARSRPSDRGPTGAAAGRARPRAAPVARPRAGFARGRADRRCARHRRRLPVPARRGPCAQAGRLRRAVAGVVGHATAAQADGRAVQGVGRRQRAVQPRRPVRLRVANRGRRRDVVAVGAAGAGGDEAATGDVARAVDRAALRGRRGRAEVLRGPQRARRGAGRRALA